MKLYLAIIGLLLVWAGVSFQVASQNKPVEISEVSASPTQEQAQQLWEKAITAKGGRAKLHNIRNVQTSEQAEYITHKGKKNTLRREELIILPDKTWSWEDYGSDVFGLRVEMSDYGAKRRYILTPESPYEELRHLSAAYTWEKFGLRDMQVSLFMETAWVKPVPVAAWTDTFNGHKVDVVKTQVGKEHIDYVLDSTTHLPVRIIFYSHAKDGTERVSGNNTFLDYVSVDGIQMPQKTTVGDGTTYVEKVQINVEYNEEIFVRPTSLADGPDAWKLKKKP